MSKTTRKPRRTKVSSRGRTVTITFGNSAKDQKMARQLIGAMAGRPQEEADTLFDKDDKTVVDELEAENERVCLPAEDGES